REWVLSAFSKLSGDCLMDSFKALKVPNIQSIAPDAEIGYILEVDLEAPVHLHDYFADYSLASEKQIIPENWLSLYMKYYALKFRQSPWMKEYIEENIRKRKIAKANGDKFGVMYYKLKNNAVFGKQMKNIHKHMRVELLRTEEDKKIRRLASSPLFEEL
ncbi:31139_t:CDS:2, partial [Racocetra persica]